LASLGGEGCLVANTRPVDELFVQSQTICGERRDKGGEFGNKFRAKREPVGCSTVFGGVLTVIPQYHPRLYG